MSLEPRERRKAPRADDPERRGRRTEPRAYVLLPASTEALSGHRYARILNVSRTGARLRGTALPEVGKEAVLRCSEVEAFGTVAWSDGDECGLRFDEPISLRQLVELRALSDASDAAELADEREAAADWASGLAR